MTSVKILVADRTVYAAEIGGHDGRIRMKMGPGHFDGGGEGWEMITGDGDWAVWWKLGYEGDDDDVEDVE